MPTRRKNSVTPQLYSSPNPSRTRGGPVGGGKAVGPPTMGSVVSGLALRAAVAPPISQGPGSPWAVRRGGRLFIVAASVVVRLKQSDQRSIDLNSVESSSNDNLPQISVTS